GPIAVLGALALSGCFFDDGHRGHYNGGYGNGYVPGQRVMTIPACPSGAAAAAKVSIDPDAGLSTDAGQGTGVFVEYKAGGHWRIFTSCDTAVTGYSCNYDVTAQVVGGTVPNVLAEGLETGDSAGSACSDSV